MQQTRKQVGNGRVTAHANVQALAGVTSCLRKSLRSALHSEEHSSFTCTTPLFVLSRFLWRTFTASPSRFSVKCKSVSPRAASSLCDVPAWTLSWASAFVCDNCRECPFTTEETECDSVSPCEPLWKNAAVPTTTVSLSNLTSNSCVDARTSWPKSCASDCNSLCS